MPPTRQTAAPCRIADLRAGTWEEGNMKIGHTTAGRVSILGVLVEKANNMIVIDDGSGTITARTFEKEVVPEVGDVVLVIGRPQEFNAGLYLVLEICKKLLDPQWIEYRKKELALLYGTTQEKSVTDVDAVIKKIRELDTGTGTPVDQILAVYPDGEAILQTLHEEGDIFEIKPGIVKVLE